MSDFLADLEASYAEKKQPSKGLQSFADYKQEKYGYATLLPDEHNKLLADYSHQYKPLYIEGNLGKRPTHGITTEYDKKANELARKWDDRYSQFVQPPNVHLENKIIIRRQQNIRTYLADENQSKKLELYLNSVSGNDVAGMAGSAATKLFVNNVNFVDINGAAKLAPLSHLLPLLLGSAAWVFLKNKPVNLKKWTAVSIDDMKSNSLYGISVWLWFFAVGCIFNFLATGGKLVQAYSNLGNSGGILSALFSDMPDILSHRFGFFFNLVFLCLVLYLLISKHKFFRPTANVYLLMAGPIQLASLWIEGVNYSPTLIGDSIMSLLVAWPLSCAIWLTYLNRSKRVRLTYEGLVFNEPPLIESKRLDVNKGNNPNVGQPPKPDVTTNNDLLWSHAMQEAEGENRQVALWARCFADADGDEAKAKARYIKLRVEVLSR